MFTMRLEMSRTGARRQGHGSERVQTMVPDHGFCEGGDHAGTGDHASSESNQKRQIVDECYLGLPSAIPRQ